MLLIPQETSAALAARPARQAWLTAGTCLVLAAVVLGGLFHAEAEAAFHVWMTSTAYNHCFLILPVALYLGWHRREALVDLQPQADLRPLLLVVPLSLLWVVAAMLGVLELQQLLVVAMFQVMALAIVGMGVYRTLLTPFLYLFFLVPTAYFLVPVLQNFTAWFTVECLRLVHIPVFWDGTLIEIPAGQFVVAEACAGLRFLIASVAFGVFFASLTYKSRVRWIIFVALSIVVPVIANGFRAFGLLVLAEISGSAAMVMADHIIYGWGFFTFVTFVLILIGRSFADRDAGADSWAVPGHGGAASPAWRLAAAAVIGLALAAIGPAYAQMQEWRTAAIDLGASSPPRVAGAWRETSSNMHWKPNILEPDREFLDEFANGDARVARYVALYRTGGLHNNLARGLNEIADFQYWRLAGTGEAQATIDGKNVTVATTEIAANGHRVLVWDFYVVGNAIVAGRAEAKLAQLRGLLDPTGHVAAFVALAADDTDPQHPAADTLARFVQDIAPLRPYLQSLEHNLRRPMLRSAATDVTVAEIASARGFCAYMKILHILDHSIPLHSGYSFRTLSILREQRARGWKTAHLTGPKHNVAASLKEDIDGWTIYRTPPLATLARRVPLLREAAIVLAMTRRIVEVARDRKA